MDKVHGMMCSHMYNQSFMILYNQSFRVLLPLKLRGLEVSCLSSW